ncbi:MAG: uroporphyrinogen decarboxylase [Enterococcus cecorum]|nr:uroporphyrinogen decarboxylase [Enterococcus cecorum]
MSKKQWFIDKVNGKNNELPVSFWLHFLDSEDQQNYLENPNVFEENLKGHRKYVEAIKPDYIKLMSDGFFQYPTREVLSVRSFADLDKLSPLSADHPWISQQVSLVQAQLQALPEEIASFYNIFSPASYYKFLLPEATRNEVLASKIVENPDLIQAVLNFIATDIQTLVREVVNEGKATGIYFSVQNVQDKRITSKDYEKIIRPSELEVIKTANQVSDYHILHICGYSHSRNDLQLYKDYAFPIFNWSTSSEKVSLAEGKDLFKDKVILGGFDNTPEGILATGTKEEILEFTKNLVDETGKERLILGADCTLPKNIDWQRIQWVQEAVSGL